MRRLVLVCALFLTLTANAADLVQLVRMKLSAGDLFTGAAAAEEYRRDSGVDAEYLNAVGWLARGAAMLNRPDLASQYVAELRREIPREKEELLTPFGAAIEVQSKLLAAQQGRGAAIRYLGGELARATDTSLRSRISKNINLLSLEGQPAPPIPGLENAAGKPVLVFLWAHWCGDCRAQSAMLTRIRERYSGKGLVMVAPTRLYGSVDQKPATPEAEQAQIAKVWSETYRGLDGVAVPVDTATMVRYGASATPTFVLIDRDGIVRLYTPTRLSESELSKRIDELL